MKISLNWIKNFVDINGISVDELSNSLTMAGLEVESVEDQNLRLKNFVIGKVLEKVKHPKADKLSVCQVDVGTEKLQIVCGAPNVDTGQTVAVALNGAVVPSNQMVIGKVKLRGVESNGMICSESELLLSDNHEGIMVLDNSLTAGTNLSEALKLNDVIFEVAITPNRPDALSHLGVARDIAVLFKRELKLPFTIKKEVASNKNEHISIEVLDYENCPRYSAKVVLDVKVGDSPNWLKDKMKAIGLRSINNVVDVTNFVLHELGQPLHAFDLDLINDKKIIVKKSSNPTFTTLDSKERKMREDILMICDGKKEIAIAGVMGGENSEVTTATKNILIESAYFNPRSVRRTSKFLGLSTDASYRFERGTDPSITAIAANRAAELISELCAGKIIDGVIDVSEKNIEKLKIVLRFARVEKILGYHVPENEIKRILTALGLEIVNESNDAIECLVPTSRSDIEREIDLIEEVARIYGYDNIPTVVRINNSLERKHDDTSFKNFSRELLISAGCYEILSNSLQTENVARAIGNPIKVLNPQSADMSHLRSSLITSMLTAIHKNISVGEKNLKLFELGNIFNMKEEKLDSFKSFSEEGKLLVAITGNSSEKEWYGEKRATDFFDLKGIVDFYLEKISLDSHSSDTYNAEGNKVFEYEWIKTSGDQKIGSGGKLNNVFLKKFEIEQDVFLFEFDISTLQSLTKKEKKFSNLLKFPKAIRDFAFIFEKKYNHEEIVEFIRREASQVLKEIKIFDLYEGKGIDDETKSLAFKLTYFDENKTLTESEIEEDFLNLISKVKTKFNAALRSA